MARILAVDWDGVEARFALGSIFKDRLVVSNVGSAPLESAAEVAAATAMDAAASESAPDAGAVDVVETDRLPAAPFASDEDEEEGDGESLGDAIPDAKVVSAVKKESFKNSPLALTLKKLFHERRVGSAKLCYMPGRVDLDVMYMTIPNASEAETPELIFNQALRDSLTFNEAQPLDFMTLGLPSISKKTGFRKVAAVSIARDKLRRIRETLAGAYRAPSRIELREPSLAEFLRAEFCGLAYAEPVVLIQELCDEVNLTLCYQKSVLYFRSFKVLPDASVRARAERIREEIVRTLAIGVDDLPENETVGRALFFSDYSKLASESEKADADSAADESLPPLLEKLLAEEEIRLDFVNPFRLAGMRVKTREPEFPGRYASLLGALLADRPQNKPAIDLLHPHEKPKPPNFTLLFVAYFLAAILFFGGAYLWNKNDLKRLNAELEDLEQKRQETAADLNKQSPQYRVLTTVNQWQNFDGVIVLDELRDLFARFPKFPDMVVTRLAYMSSYTGNGYAALRNRPVFIISAKITSLQVYSWFRQNVQNGNVHQVYSSGPVNNEGGGAYKFMFEAFILCGRRNAESLLAVQPQEIKQISGNRPEHYVELEEERKRQVAETQEKNYKDALEIADKTSEVLSGDPGASPSDGGAPPETSIEQDSEYAQKLVQARQSLRDNFTRINNLAQNGALTPEQFNELKTRYNSKEAEIVHKWIAVNARSNLKRIKSVRENALKILDAARENAKEPSLETDQQLLQTLVKYRQVIDGCFLNAQELLKKQIIDQAQFGSVKEFYQKEVESIVREYEETRKRVQAYGQPTPPSEGQPSAEQPAPSSEGQLSAEQSAPPSGGQPSAEQPSPPSEGQPSAEQPSPPSEGQPSAEQPSPPSEGQPSAEQPAPPSGGQPSAEQPAPPSEAQSSAEQPTPPSEGQTPAEQSAPPSEAQSSAEQPTPPSEGQTPAEQSAPPSEGQPPATSEIWSTSGPSSTLANARQTLTKRSTPARLEFA